MSTNTDDRAQLLQVLKSRSVFYGDFVLSSGAKSSFYFDCRLTTLAPEAAWLVGTVIFRMVQAEARRRNVTIDAIGGLTMGADPISLAVGMVSFREAPSKPLDVFVVRKAPKSHGQTKLIEGNFSRGDRVVVIDDVVTRGDSTLAAVKAVRDEGGIVEFVVVLIDREEGGRQKIEESGVPVLSVFKKSDILDADKLRSTPEQRTQSPTGAAVA